MNAGKVAAVVAMTLLIGASRSYAETRLEVSPRVSSVVAFGGGAVLGWQMSLADSRRKNTFLVDGGAYHFEGESLGVVMAGYRHRDCTECRASGFVQILAGAAVAEGGAVFVAHPGVGLDFAVDKRVGARVQLDWPLMVSGIVTFRGARLSAGIVIRPRPRSERAYNRH
jgi:hypothetical protein